MTAENTNFQISNSDVAKQKLSDREKRLRETTDLNPIYLSQIINYIEARIEDPILKNMVLARANKYPHSALKNFFSRFPTIVADCNRIINERKAKEHFQPVRKQVTEPVPFQNNDLINLQEQLEKDHKEKEDV